MRQMLLPNLNTFLQDTRTFLKVAGELTAKLNAAADPTREQLSDTLTGIRNLSDQLSAIMERLEDNPDQLLRGNRAPAVK